MTDFLDWLLTTDHLQDFSILMLCFCIVMFGRAVDRHNKQIFWLQREVKELTRQCSACAGIRNVREEGDGSEKTV